jgi:hypothetical protein
MVFIWLSILGVILGSVQLPVNWVFHLYFSFELRETALQGEA